jgi:phospholipid transport system substrate-binding protein
MSQVWKLLASYLLLGTLALAGSIDFALAGAVHRVGPQERVQATLQAVSAILEDPTLRGAETDQERKQRVRQIIYASFDFREMARESLGTHWGTLTPSQRDEFIELFGSLFERSYNRLVLRILGERHTLYGSESIQQDRAIVATTLVGKQDARLPVNYRLVRHSEQWAIYDVAIDGVSLAMNYRAQFSKILRTSSYEVLVQRIRAKLEEESL